jgi:4-hydroxy-3-methylbut-2-enyl diphosphate reductase
LKSLKTKAGTLVITAHGIGPEIYKFAEKKGINIVDTTCPKVIKVQRLARNFSKKEYQIVIIGEKNHKEVRGIYEWAEKKAFFVETKGDLADLALDPKRNIAILSQTTQDKDFVLRSAAYIAKKYPKTKIIDSICLATQHRQTEIKKLAKAKNLVESFRYKFNQNPSRKIKT